MKPYTKIFLVDDCPFFVKLCEKGLIKNGFSNIHIFNSGEELISNLFLKPDIIFLDYHLNDFTGKELLYKIKTFNPLIEVVIISNQKSMDITIELLNSGAFDYLIKDNNFVEKLSEVSSKLDSVFAGRQNTAGVGIDNFSRREYTNIVLNAQKKVQMEISIELHDNISQLLSTSKMYLEIAASDSSKSVALVKDSISILKTAITDIRLLSHNLRSLFLHSEDLNIKLPALINQLKASERFIVTDAIEIENFNNYLTPFIQQNILRILQELLNNIQKHSQAKNIFIEIVKLNKGLSINVRDDGKGFDVHMKKSGIGLNNIFTRISNISGVYELNTAKNKGCSWNIFIPAVDQMEQLSENNSTALAKN